MTGKRNQSVHVLFATVTGNAEEIARRIHAELKDEKLPQGVLCAVQDYETTGLGTPDAMHDAFVFVASTTGDGDAPDTARPFMRFLRKKNPSLLKDVPYAVLGLGDTNYENFCKTGKRFDASLKKLGGIAFYPRGDADDGVGLEEVVEPWIDGLWDALRKVIKTNPPENDDISAVVVEAVREITEEELGFDESVLPRLLPPSTSLRLAVERGTENSRSLSSFYDALSTQIVEVSGASQLTADEALKEVWHMEVRFTGDGIQYRPGDAFGLLVENDTDEVNRFLKFVPEGDESVYELMDASEKSIAIGSARRLLSERADIRAVPKKTLLRALSRHCAEQSERRRLLELCSKDGRTQYKETILDQQMSVLSLLETIAPSCRPPLDLLMDQLPPLAPRWYSAASAPGKDGINELHFAFSLVDGGLATSKLAKLCNRFLEGSRGDTLLFIPRSSDSTSAFHPPNDMSTPFVMVGPGTGVAPFRGFLRERSSQMADGVSMMGRSMLFFGCRHPEKDYLYRSELEGMRDDGVLDVLDVAFSRLTATKEYVQDRMRKRAEEVAQVIKDGGSLFVCGDGGGMAKGVDDALRDIVASHLCEGDNAQAKQFIKTMAANNRYVRDIWYFG